MSTLDINLDVKQWEHEIRTRRLWYHDIEISDGLRTRFREDYEVSPVLRRVDEGNQAMLEWAQQHLPSDLTHLSVLDLGCADGLFSFWAARRGARRVVGIERNQYNFEHATLLKEILNLPNVEFRCGSLEKHLPEEPFDIVFMNGLIYHLINPLGTLHRLRLICRHTLILSSAIDLPDGQGSPLSRLDRYATGAHGLWSFNVPFVQQLLTTSGFDIIQDETTGESTGRLYQAAVAPGEFSHHHIFEDKVNQEFPINVDRRTDRVRKSWEKLSKQISGPVAIFGAGTHTPWMLDQISDFNKIPITCILDERLPLEKTLAGLIVQDPKEFDVRTVDAIVISSWHQSEVIHTRAKQLFGDQVMMTSLGE